MVLVGADADSAGVARVGYCRQHPRVEVAVGVTEEAHSGSEQLLEVRARAPHLLPNFLWPERRKPTVALAMAADENPGRLQIEELAARKKLLRLMVPARAPSDHAADDENGGGKRAGLQHRQGQPQRFPIAVVEGDCKSASFAGLGGAQSQVYGNARVGVCREPVQMSLQPRHGRADAVWVVEGLGFDDAVVCEYRHPGQRCHRAASLAGPAAALKLGLATAVTTSAIRSMKCSIVIPASIVRRPSLPRQRLSFGWSSSQRMASLKAEASPGGTSSPLC